MKTIFLLMLSTLMALTVTACGGNGSEALTDEPIGSTVKDVSDPADATDSANENDDPAVMETDGDNSSELFGVQGVFSEDDYYITISGITLAVGDDFLPYVYALGSPEIAEGQACLDGGYDTNYYYGDSLAIYTYAENGKQIIYDIYITGPEYTTQKGARIGETTEAEIYAMYGEPAESFRTTYNYQLADSDIIVSFTFSDNVLESIDILDGGVGV